MKEKGSGPPSRKTSFAPLPQFDDRLNSTDDEFDEFFAKANEQKIRAASIGSESSSRPNSRPLFNLSTKLQHKRFLTIIGDVEDDHSSHSEDEAPPGLRPFEIPIIKLPNNGTSSDEEDESFDLLLQKAPPTNLIDMDFKTMVAAVNDKYSPTDFPFED
jgi:hypothetical protein